MMTERTDEETGRDEGRAQYESICEAMAALQCLDDGLASADYNGDTYTTPHELIDVLRESPLGVSVRSAWTVPGNPMEAAEYHIDLSMGGPACRITGQLDTYDEPADAHIEYQNWLMPWTEYDGEPDGEHGAQAVLDFARLFYYAA